MAIEALCWQNVEGDINLLEPLRHNLPLHWNLNRKEWLTFLTQNGNKNTIRSSSYRLDEIMVVKYVGLLCLAHCMCSINKCKFGWFQFLENQIQGAGLLDGDARLSPWGPPTAAAPALIPPSPLTKHITHSPGISLCTSLLLGMLFPLTLSQSGTKSMGLGVRPGLEFWLCHFLFIYFFSCVALGSLLKTLQTLVSST